MDAFITNLVKDAEEVWIDKKDLKEFSNWLALQGMNFESSDEVILEALKENNLESVQSETGKGSHRGSYIRHRFRIKRFTLLAILATLLCTPWYMSSIAPSAISWIDLKNWLADLIGINVLQLIGILESLFEVCRLELSHDEESVLKTISAKPQTINKIRNHIHKRFPNFSDRELDNIFERLTSNGFLRIGHDAKGRETYQLNLKWKKMKTER